MQHVELPPEPTGLASVRKVTEERRAVEEFYAQAANAGARYPEEFAAYKNKLIRSSLDTTFHKKCAYCESSYAGTAPADIEHYRPKGGVLVDRTLTPPGYWWLASEWSNLMPCCRDCNAPRGQDFPGGLKPVTAGKSNQFPLAPGSPRAQKRGEEQQERRLLLNPYLDFPEEHLRFVVGVGFRDGEIEPRPRGRAGRASRQAKTSIEVYALQRIGLVEDRKKILVKLAAYLKLVEVLHRAVLRDPADQQALTDFEAAVADIGLYTSPDQPFSAMCRQVAHEFMRTHLRSQL